jgi:thiol-disulfide isomerase/thioredoxin
MKNFFILSLFSLNALTAHSGEIKSNAKNIQSSLSQLFVLQGQSLADEFKANKDNKLYVLDFWASWCEPCKDALPFYLELKKKFSQKGVFIIGISADSSKQEAMDFLEKNKYDLNMAWDSQKILTKHLDISAIPTLVIVSHQGDLLEKQFGFNSDKKSKIESLIQKHLKHALDRDK